MANTLSYEDELFVKLLESARKSCPGLLPEPIPEAIKCSAKEKLLGEACRSLSADDQGELRSFVGSWLQKRHPDGLPEAAVWHLRYWLLTTLSEGCEAAQRDAAAERERDAALDGLLTGLTAGRVDIAAARDELEEYYEAAGFEDYGVRVLSGMGDEAVLDLYIGTFYDVEPQHEEGSADLEEWRVLRDEAWAEALRKIAMPTL